MEGYPKTPIFFQSSRGVVYPIKMPNQLMIIHPYMIRFYERHYPHFFSHGILFLCQVVTSGVFQSKRAVSSRCLPVYFTISSLFKITNVKIPGMVANFFQSFYRFSTLLCLVFLRKGHFANKFIVVFGNVLHCKGFLIN